MRHEPSAPERIEVAHIRRRDARCGHRPEAVCGLVIAGSVALWDEATLVLAICNVSAEVDGQ